MSHVIPHFIGRTGNSLFQIAAAIGYAKKHGFTWSIPSFNKEVPNFHSMFPNLPVNDWWGGERYEAHDPSMFNYQEIPYFQYGVKLLGFFQSEKYFLNAEAEVREVFKLKEYPELKDYVSIHVRRGDYVQHSNSFPPVDEVYLSEAIDQIHFLTGEVPRLMIFSDGMDWCRKYFKDYKEGHVIFAESDPENPIENLAMMASCSHNIIANSSYSWWASWLNKNPDKIVVSPDPTSWFGPNGPTKIEDLIPESWIKIKFR